MRQLEMFVHGPQELRWLIDTALMNMREWAGIAELRGLYCTRFSPKDGKDVYCTLPGFTPADSETGYHAIQAAETERCLLEYKREKLLAPPDEVFDAPPLPVAKPIAPAPPMSRTDQDVQAHQARERLTATVNKSVTPVVIPATPIRTPEERGRVKAEMVEKLRALGWTPEQVAHA